MSEEVKSHISKTEVSVSPYTVFISRYAIKQPVAVPKKDKHGCATLKVEFLIWGPNKGVQKYDEILKALEEAIKTLGDRDAC